MKFLKLFLLLLCAIAAVFILLRFVAAPKVAPGPVHEAPPATTTTVITPATHAGIVGTAMLGPTCPVQRIPPDPACADKPYKGPLEVSTVDGSEVVDTFTTDSKGAFKRDLLPGDYTITTLGSSLYPRCSSTGAIHVTSSGYVTVQVSCDTGIR